VVEKVVASGWNLEGESQKGTAGTSNFSPYVSLSLKGSYPLQSGSTENHEGATAAGTVVP